MNEQDKKLIIQFWESGLSIRKIVKLLPYKPYHILIAIKELRQNGTIGGKSGKSKEKTWEKVLQAYNNGTTNPHDIAEMFGLKVNTVNVILGNSQLGRKKPKHNYKQMEIGEKTRQIIMEIQSGKPLHEIAKAHGTSRQYVHKVKNKYVKEQQNER